MKKFLGIIITNLIISQIAFSAPLEFNVQGLLTDSQGTPVTVPTEVTIGLYRGGSANTANDGLPVYKEIQTITPDSEGVYNFFLGNGTPIEGHTLIQDDFVTSDDLFLQLTSDGTTFLPRIRLVSNPYAIVAGISNQAGVNSVTSVSIQDASITESKISNDAVTSGKILDSAIVESKIADNAVTNGKISNLSVTETKISGDAVTSAKILNGTIQQEDLSSSLISGRLIPTGMVALFTGSCPTGWSRFSALDDRFPFGSPTAGTTGGSTTHSHGIQPDGAHDIETEEVTKTGSRVAPPGPSFQNDEYLEDTGSTVSKRWGKHKHNIPAVPNHDHTGNTDQANHLPPYYTMNYCQKD